MTDSTTEIVGIFEQHPVAVAIVAASAVVLLVLAVLAARRAGRALKRVRKRVSDDNLLTYLSASIATGVSAQGMWPFFRETVSLPVWLTVGFFAFIELMVLASAVRARKSMKESYSAGVDGVAMWVLTCLSAVLSATHAESFGEVLFRLSAPLVAAWGWERSMKLERRRRTGATGINWRLTPERILTRLGLADPTDRNASEVDVHRRLLRLALSAKRARTAKGWRRKHALNRVDKAMEGAVEYGGLGSDPASEARLMAALGALFAARDLVDLRPAAPWHSPDPVAALGAATEADETPAIGMLLDGESALVIGRERAAGVLPSGESALADSRDRLDMVLPDGESAHESTRDRSPGVLPADKPALATARKRYAKMLAAGEVPSVRRIIREMKMGHAKATRIKDALDRL